MAAIDDANSRDITFCSDLHSVSSISKSNAGIILCNKKLGGKVKPKENQLLIFLSNPKLAFIHIAKNYLKSETNLTSLILYQKYQEQQKLATIV